MTETKPLDLDQFERRPPAKEPIIDLAMRLIDEKSALLTECRRLRAENEKLREALKSIQTQLYQKDQEEITRINDAYDAARDALGAP